jgi:hypothetical protein
VEKRKVYIFPFLLVIGFIIHLNAYAQIVKADADRNKILIGEQIKVKLKLETARRIPTWFQFPDSVNHFLIVNRSKIDTVLNGPFTNYYQTITITSFDSGRWEFPSLSVASINKATNPITIDVLPVDVSKLQDYHDIKEIEEVKQENNKTIIAIIVAITLLSIIMIYILMKKKKAIVIPQPVLKGDTSPLQWALNELSKLQQQGLYKNGQVKKHYIELTNISRKYFDLQLNQQVLHQTTDEWMMKLQSLPVDPEPKTSFIQLLRLADTVKFAKYIPPVDESEKSIDTTKQMLQKIAQMQQSAHINYQPQL